MKAAVLFAAFSFAFAAFNPMPAIGRLSLYNWLLPGRARLPYGDDPQRSYNLNLYSLEAMFASHELAGREKAEDEFRVFVIGDSSVWGFLLENDDTLSAALNRFDLHSADGKNAVFYNLGHPTISLTKDLMILDYAMQYEPDLIVWLVTLEAFPRTKQASSPLVQNNPERIADLVSTYQLPIALGSDFTQPTFIERTLVGQRRNLADILRLQLYGFMWGATGVDTYIPDEIELRATDLEASEDYSGLQPSTLQASDLAMDVLAAGIRRAGDVPMLIVNEPIFVSQGANSDIRYNSFYPRWAYDAYRELMLAESRGQGWSYVDLWQAVSNDEFTNTPIHLTPQGTLELVDAIRSALGEQFNFRP